MKWLLLSIVFSLTAFFANAQHGDLKNWDESYRKAWVDSVLRNFDKHLPDTNIMAINLNLRHLGDVTLLSIKVKGEGLFNLNEKGWIYFLSNSNHNNPGVGDLTIAIDQKGEAWYNEGHVCGGIINFATKDLLELKNSQEFFKYFVSDTDDEKWVRIN